MATLNDLIGCQWSLGNSGVKFGVRNNDTYLTTSNPYADEYMFPKSILKDVAKEAYEYWKRDEEDTARLYKHMLNSKYGYKAMFEKEKEMELKEKLRIVRNEVDDMAERYSLSISTTYNSRCDRLEVSCGKITRGIAVSDKLVTNDFRYKSPKYVLERIEHWLVNAFDVNPDRNPVLVPKITNVIHNDPATIVFWGDGTKTVVKCQEGDIYDPEKGLAMAISKKALGNKGNYCEVFKKWLPEEVEDLKRSEKTE